MPVTLIVLIIYINVIPFYYVDEAVVGHSMYIFVKYLPFILSVLFFCQVLIKQKAILLYEIKNQRLIHLLLVFQLWCIFTLCFSDYTRLGLIKNIYYTFTGVLIFLSIVLLKINLQDLKKVANYTVVSVTVTAIYGIYAYISSSDPFWFYLPLENKHYIISEVVKTYENNFADKHWVDHYKSTYRVVSTVGNPVVYSSLLSSTIPLILFFIFSSRKNTTRFFYVFLFFSVAFCTLLTFSRGAYLSGCIGICTFIIMAVDKENICLSRIIKTSAIFFIIIFLIMNLFEKSATKAFDLMSLRFDNFLDSNSILSRISRIETAIYLMEENYLTGLGNTVLTDYIRDNSHIISFNSSIVTMDNMYLTIMCEVGVVGILLFLLFLLKAVFQPTIALMKSFQDSNNYAKTFAFACSASIFSMIFNMATWDLLNNPVMRVNFWILLGLFFHSCNLHKVYKSN